MIYVLDTDILSLLAHKDSPEAPRMRRRIAELPAEHSVVTTVINYEEQIRGWMSALAQAKSSKSEIQIYARLLQRLTTFRRITVLEYDEAAAKTVEHFRRQRMRIGAMDLKIAAIALACDGILITRNAADFRKFAALPIEDWSIERER